MHIYHFHAFFCQEIGIVVELARAQGVCTRQIGRAIAQRTDDHGGDLLSRGACRAAWHAALNPAALREGRVATLGPARRADPILGLRAGLEAIPNGDIGAKQRLAPTHIFEFLERMASTQDPAARVIWGPAVARQSPL